MRRSACLSVALAVLLSLMVASAGAAGATTDPGGVYVPVARGEDPDAEDSADEKADKARKKADKEDCPQDMWVVALPVEGLACVLLLPKPPPEDGEEGGSGGLGGLF
ncbi:MAG: hypothetical protein ACRD0O_06525 [Acidimicrobiia bacterium]